jgi:pimeloyl-ACP methyl ester carboxylesterase
VKKNMTPSIPECTLKKYVNGHNLNVKISGPEKGRAVVLLHHGLGSVRAWRKQVPVLVEAGFRVVTYDRWGYGDSDPRTGLDLPSFSNDVNDLDCLMGQLGIQKAALVGHSDGGSIALYFAALQPMKVSCLVIVAAHIYVELKMEPGILEVRQAFEDKKHFRNGMQYAHGEKYESVFKNWFEGWHQPEMLAWDMRPILNQIRCPVLVVQGVEDEYASPQHAMDIASSIPGAELWLIPRAEHLLPQENAAIFNPRILRFINDHAIDEQ